MSVKKCLHRAKFNKERYFLIGFVFSLLTVLWHLLHCALPLFLPLIILLNIPVPHIIHEVRIPLSLTLLTSLWIAFFLFRKKLTFYWLRF